MDSALNELEKHEEERDGQVGTESRTFDNINYEGIYMCLYATVDFRPWTL